MSKLSLLMVCCALGCSVDGSGLRVGTASCPRVDAGTDLARDAGREADGGDLPDARQTDLAAESPEVVLAGDDLGHRDRQGGDLPAAPDVLQVGIDAGRGDVPVDVTAEAGLEARPEAGGEARREVEPDVVAPPGDLGRDREPRPEAGPEAMVCPASCLTGCNVGCGANGRCVACGTCTCSGETGVCHC